MRASHSWERKTDLLEVAIDIAVAAGQFELGIAILENLSAAYQGLLLDRAVAQRYRNRCGNSILESVHPVLRPLSLSPLSLSPLSLSPLSLSPLSLRQSSLSSFSVLAQY